MHVSSLIALLLLATATVVTAAAAAPYNCSRFPNVLPEIHVEGDHYDVGFAVGRTFRAAIARQLAASGSFQHTLLPFYATKAGRAYYDTYFKTANDTFPGYVAEIQGMADGAARHDSAEDRLFYRLLKALPSSTHSCTAMAWILIPAYCFAIP